jgi:hypothetical protein
MNKNKKECNKCLFLEQCQLYFQNLGYNQVEIKDFCDNCRELLNQQGWKLTK